MAQITGAEVFGQPDAIDFVEDVLIDSRKFISGSRSVFVALKTSANDGHLFIQGLIDKGVRCFLVSTLPENIETGVYLLVKDTLKSLQKISIFHRKQFEIPVIGITGSNGKTIVKEWLFQVLSDSYHIVRSPKSYNSQIGVPLSVLQLNPEADLAIFEAGISMPDEMDYLQQIILPDIGIFTNIGHAHDENFIDKRQKINEKIQLFKKSKQIIFCRDHGEISERILSIEAFRYKKLTSWSLRNRTADLFIEISDNQRYKCTYRGQIFEIELPFSDSASLENIFHVILTSLELGISIEDLKSRIQRLSPVAMRLELKAGINNCTIINDVYNSDLNSILIAIDFLAQQKNANSRTVIMSDIMQSGMNEYTLYKRVAEWIKKNDIAIFIGIGKAIRRQQALFEGEKYFYDTTEEFLSSFPISGFSNQTILLKGARVFEFERISNLLQQKAHQTVMEINLTALVSNLNFFKSQLSADTKIMAMVKAFSYGSGSFEIANVLKYHNVNYLAVAYTDEGVELRKSGIAMPIMVMNPDENAFDMMILHDLEPEIYSMSVLKKYIQAVQNSLIPEIKKVGIHIKIDSGMHRLGFGLEEMDELSEILKKESQIEVRSVFSHLVASDREEFDDFTKMQADYFTQCADFLQNKLQNSFYRHLLNSSGICRFPEYQFNMVRLGIGLYGFGTCTSESGCLRNALKLKSIISQIKKVPKGESVGYNRSFIANCDMVSATIPIGYADGFDRKLGNGVGKVFIKGAEAKVIGDVCMDMVMVDVTGLDVSEGDEVVIFDDNFTVKDMAALLKTIPYEVMTSISSRVKRVYYQE